MGLDGVKIFMMLKTTILKVVTVVVVIVVLVQSMSVTILDDAVLKPVVEVNIMVHYDAALKVVLSVDVIVIVRVLGGGVKEDSVQVVVVTDTSDIANAVGQAMQVADDRIIAMVARTTIRRGAYHHR